MTQDVIVGVLLKWGKTAGLGLVDLREVKTCSTPPGEVPRLLNFWTILDLLKQLEGAGAL